MTMNATTTKPNIETVGTADGRDFVRIDGALYALDRRPMADGSKLGPGEVAVSEKIEKITDGTRQRSTQRTRAVRVDDDAYELATARDGKAARRAAPRRRVVDVLGALPALRRRLPVGIPAGPSIADRHEPVIGLVDGAVTGGYIEGKPAVSSPTVGFFAKHGLHLSLTPGGRVLVESEDSNPRGVFLDAIREAERLLIAELSGVDLVCELPHDGKPPTAVGMVAISVLVCVDHLAGRLPTTMEKPDAA